MFLVYEVLDVPSSIRLGNTLLIELWGFNKLKCMKHWAMLNIQYFVNINCYFLTYMDGKFCFVKHYIQLYAFSFSDISIFIETF